jgi:tetratricopeptide (TPR) repeat protein
MPRRPLLLTARLHLPVIVIVTVIAFLPSLRNGLVSWDDFANLRDNPHVHGLSASNLRWMFTEFHHGHYQPLTWLTLALDYTLWGGRPLGYHVTSLLIHAVNAWLFYRLSRRLIERASDDVAAREWAPAGAFFAALCFAIHPLRVESVAWATERRDVLSGLFCLLTALAYMRAHDDRTQASGGWLAVSLACFGMALLSKVISSMVAPVLLVIDAYPLRRWRPTEPLARRSLHVLAEKSPFLAMALLVGCVGLFAQRDAAAIRPLSSYGIESRIAQSLYSLTFYARKTILPTSLSCLYELPQRVSLREPKFIVRALLVVGITITLIALARRWPAALTAWTAHAIILLPVSGLLQNGPQLAADRYSYLSCMSFAILVGAGAARGLTAKPGVRGLMTASALAAIVALSSLTWRQTAVWRNSLTLWAHALRVDADSHTANNSYGVALVKERHEGTERERYQDARPYFEAAVALRENYDNGHYNLGQALSVLGAPDEAERHLRRAIELNRSASTLTALGEYLSGRRRFAEAFSVFREAVGLEPADFDAHFRFAVALHDAGMHDEAIQQYEQARTLRPKDVGVLNNLAQVLIARGRLDEAAIHLQEAARIAPDHPVVQRSLVDLAAARARR